MTILETESNADTHHDFHSWVSENYTREKQEFYLEEENKDVISDTLYLMFLKHITTVLNGIQELQDVEQPWKRTQTAIFNPGSNYARSCKKAIMLMFSLMVLSQHKMEDLFENCDEVNILKYVDTSFGRRLLSNFFNSEQRKALISKNKTKEEGTVSTL